jgi:AcrR family transcriptional regulator
LSEAERARLMDAALKIMRVNGFQRASVQDILDEAGLGTRAFYRQFRSKDDLLLAMFRTASQRDVDAVVARVEAAVGPRPGLEAWIDEMLAIAFDRRRLSRMVMFNAAARQTAGFDDEVEYMRAALTRPLVGVLASEAFPRAVPDTDAGAIFDLLWSVAGPAGRERRGTERADARATVLRFCLPALGAEPDEIRSVSS